MIKKTVNPADYVVLFEIDARADIEDTIQGFEVFTHKTAAVQFIERNEENWTSYRLYRAYEVSL